jgi:hypothetical protein
MTLGSVVDAGTFWNPGSVRFGNAVSPAWWYCNTVVKSVLSYQTVAGAELDALGADVPEPELA